ncbi:MAG TPA: copper homeostasis membrane protein CopD [Burkholderiales bacterium]|nr:copper homeostasis membrane protein CopD [Burkholderiales bacterium]
MSAPPPDPWLAAVRAVHFAATILLFGQFAFAAFVAADRQPAPHFRRAAAWSIAALLASALAWIALEAISMSGLPAREALSPGTLATVIGRTQFGRVWLARIVVCLALVAVLAASRRPGATAAGGLLSALLLAALAAMGHGGSGRGAAGALHFGIDAAHLLAAGAWLGALPPLVIALRSAGTAAASEAAQRFSTLGVIGMLVIVASGVANAWYMLSGFPALVESAYGRWLLAKLALFAVILGTAAVNRWRLAPRRELRGIARNAIAECVLGFAIIAIVGELGIMIPGPHGMR